MKARSFLVVGLVAAVTACGGGAKDGKGAASANDGAGNGTGESSGTDDGDGASAKEASVAKIHAPATGTKWLEHRSASLDFELVLKKSQDKAAGGMQAGSWSLEEERSYEVLASAGAKVEKLRVVFGKREAKPLLGVELTTATAGHGYVLEPKGVTRVDGTEPNAEERDALKSEYDWIGSPSPLLTWLGGGDLADGKSVEGGSAEARGVVGVLDGIDYSNAHVKATSHGKNGHELSLDVEVKLRLTSAQTYFDLDLKGPAKVDLDKGWVSELDLSGTAKASGHLQHKKGLLDVSGKGNATLKRSIESH
jgi:hypothetical protein